MRKLRIAQVTNLQESVPPLNKNGLEQVVSYITEELVSMGHDVTLFATGDSKTSAKLVPVWPMAVSRDTLGSTIQSATYTRWSVSEVFARYKEFDIIHDHTRFEAPYFADLIPTPIVSTVHHPITASPEEGYWTRYPEKYWSYFQNSWEKKISSVTTVVVSKYQSAEFKRPCEVIWNGVPVDSWPFTHDTNGYHAFLGYITANKGASEAIQAILPTNQRLKIAGPIRADDPKAQQYFEEKIKPFLSDRIEYVGPLNYEEKQQFLGGAISTLLPIQWDEPFGMVAIESMACGTPVIAWNRAAMPEIIVDGLNGYLVSSVEEMTAKILEVGNLNRSSSRKHVEENFTSAKMAQNYESLYYRLLDEKK